MATEPAPLLRFGDMWDWHDVVHSEDFSEPVDDDEAEPGWNWRYSWALFRHAIMPLLFTAIALSMALLAFAGLVAQPFPWSPKPLFNGGGARPTVTPHGRSIPTKDGRPAHATEGPVAPGGTATSAQDPTINGQPASTTAAAPTATSTPGPPLRSLLPTSPITLPSVSLTVAVSLPISVPVSLPPLPPLSGITSGLPLPPLPVQLP